MDRTINKLGRAIPQGVKIVKTPQKLGFISHIKWILFAGFSFLTKFCASRCDFGASQYPNNHGTLERLELSS